MKICITSESNEAKRLKEIAGSTEGIELCDVEKIYEADVVIYFSLNDMKKYFVHPDGRIIFFVYCESPIWYYTQVFKCVTIEDLENNFPKFIADCCA
ncbi:MAG: hypothetical protein M0P97_01055 [Candidatus Moranbacteria bacterium]|jgi:hypothetical protein|nr:hypothetical protein [Candidatus Moranbacteria bacterium]